MTIEQIASGASGLTTSRVGHSGRMWGGADEAQAIATQPGDHHA
jgi:hypothetical protein